MLRRERKGDRAQGMQTHRRARQACHGGVAARAWVVFALRSGAARVNGYGGKERGGLLCGQQKGDHAQGTLTHCRAILACRGGRAASVWVVRALLKGAEVRGRMVKGVRGGAGCCVGSKRATTRRACKRTASQRKQEAGAAAYVPGGQEVAKNIHNGKPLVLYLPCEMARKCGGEWFRGKGGGAGCCAGSKRATMRRACKRTAAQDRHAEEDVLPVLGLNVPCAMARRCGG
jgi:hypothetical protein